MNEERKARLDAALASLKRQYGPGSIYNHTEEQRAIAAIRKHIVEVVRFNNPPKPAPVISIPGSWDGYADHIANTNKQRAEKGLRPWSL